MENTGFLVSRVSISYLSLFLKILQINNNIPYLLATPKKLFLVWNFCAQATWKLRILNYPNEMEDMKTKLTEMHTQCPILAVGCCWLSVILQISNFEAILYLGHFFDTLYSEEKSNKRFLMPKFPPRMF